MFLLSLYGKNKLYSTKQLANQNAANWLKKFVIDNHWLWTEGSTVVYRKGFEEDFQQEHYSGCVAFWNEYVTSSLPSPHNSFLATIKEIMIDEPLQ